MRAYLDSHCPILLYAFSSHRFIQDYGFLPPLSCPSLRKANRATVKAVKAQILKSLEETTLEQDQALIASNILTPNQALAVQFRISLKEAL